MILVKNLSVELIENCFFCLFFGKNVMDVFTKHMAL